MYIYCADNFNSNFCIFYPLRPSCRLLSRPSYRLLSVITKITKQFKMHSIHRWIKNWKLTSPPLPPLSPPNLVNQDCEVRC